MTSEGPKQTELNNAAESYLNWIRSADNVAVRYEVHVSDGAHKQWHAHGATFSEAVKNLRLMRGD